MIPDNITSDHIIKAIQEIDSTGRERPSRKYFVLYKGRKYPPKLVISLANKFPNGRELSSSEFSGGAETNNFLRKRGFDIELSAPTDGPPDHDPRCRDCKSTVEKLLKKLYGEVRKNYTIDAGSKPDDYKTSNHYQTLVTILSVLEEQRGFKNFIGAPRLPNVDFFIPNPGFVLEFDESQHFSDCRRLALENYPDNLEVEFDRQLWIQLCKNIQAKDNDPLDRDERRAWYDTLRDFLPTVKGLSPTVRLYAADRPWCALNPALPKDVETFRVIVEGRRKQTCARGIEIRYDPHAALGRIVIQGEWGGDLQTARDLLEHVSEAWPSGEYVQCLITPGAFITFGNPDSLPKVADNINTPPETVELLFSGVRDICTKLLTDDLIKRLSNCTRYITIGVDSKKDNISQTQNYIRQTHVEMVCVVDLIRRKFDVTGKAYPTPQQEHNLIRIPSLKSHFVDLDCGSVMVLGCHDLSMFNPRGRATAKGWRKRVSEEFLHLAWARRPIIVLHHPHTTIKATTWIHAWNTLRKDLPWVKNYLGAGRYSQDDAGWSKRNSLDEVLAKTKMGPVVDVIVRLEDCD